MVNLWVNHLIIYINQNFDLSETYDPAQSHRQGINSPSHILSPFKRTWGLSDEIDFMVNLWVNHLIIYIYSHLDRSETYHPVQSHRQPGNQFPVSYIKSV